MARTALSGGAHVTQREVHIADVIDMAEMAGMVHRLEWAVIREMLAGGEAFVFRVDGRAVAWAGFYPLPDGEAEAWFNFTPDAARSMVWILRETRLTMRARAYRAIHTICVTPAGRRFAGLAGFVFDRTLDNGEAWTWRNFSE